MNIKIIESPVIENLINVIKYAKLFIAVDSFPIHLADSYNTSFIGIFGPTKASSVLVNHYKSIQFEVDTLQRISNENLLKEIKEKIKLEKIF